MSTAKPAATIAAKPAAEQAQVLKGQASGVKTQEELTEVRTAAPEAAIRDERRAELARHEERVAAYRLSWEPAGKALIKIKEKGLWELVSPNWDAYVRDHIRLTGRHTRSLIEGAKIAHNVRDVSRDLCLSAALELRHLKPEQQAPCLAEAIKASGGRRDPTAKCVAEQVAKVLGKSPAKRRRSGKRTMKLKSGSMTLSLKKGADRRHLIEEAIAELTEALAQITKTEGAQPRHAA